MESGQYLAGVFAQDVGIFESDCEYRVGNKNADGSNYHEPANCFLSPH
jgi:hypothetical protein